jgi:methylenetetrahydrofolate dehydrogenase (NADP+)/methenyltetrahydrofolate cyclohydrolase
LAAHILDGKALARTIQSDIAAQVPALAAKLSRPPGLAVVLVGSDPASQVYVRNKQKACRAAGMEGFGHILADATTEDQLLRLIDGLNANPEVDGILVQLPLPRHIDERRVLDRVDPGKDVDGFHPLNAGLLALGMPRFIPCTPLGVQRLLVEAGVPIRGANAVVLGRSNIVGKPMALLLMQKGAGADATVTVCHTGTPDPAAIARQADILIVAMGRPEAVGPDWVKPGAAVVDVGMHRRADGSLCGDVRIAEVAEVAGWITPVPGGVGPMTIAMLLQNTLHAAQLRVAKDAP